MNGFMQWNMDILYAIAELRSGFLVALFQIITMFGEELIPIILLCLIYWCINKNLAYGIGIAFFTTGNIVQGMKIGFRIPRPWDLDAGFAAVATEQAKLFGSYSFPSGHTQTAAALFGTLGFALKKRGLQIACFIMVLLVGFSRMILGVHTPLDVVVSLILVLTTAYFASRFLCGGSSAKTDLIAFVLVTALSVGLLALATRLNVSGVISDAYAADSFKQAASALGFGFGIYAERRYIKMEVKTKTFWGQALKYICGMVGVLAIKEGLKFIIGTGRIVDAFRYYLLLLWIAAIYPLIVKAVMKRRSKVNE